MIAVFDISQRSPFSGYHLKSISVMCFSFCWCLHFPAFLGDDSPFFIQSSSYMTPFTRGDVMSQSKRSVFRALHFSLCNHVANFHWLAAWWISSKIPAKVTLRQGKNTPEYCLHNKKERHQIRPMSGIQSCSVWWTTFITLVAIELIFSLLTS